MSLASIYPTPLFSMDSLKDSAKDFIKTLQNSPAITISMLAGAIFGMTSHFFFNRFLDNWMAMKPAKESPWELRNNHPLVLNHNDSRTATVTKIATIILTASLAIYAIESFLRLIEIFRFSDEEKNEIDRGHISSFQMLWEKVQNFGISFLLLPKAFLDPFLHKDAPWSLRYGHYFFPKPEDHLCIKIAKIAIILLTAGLIFPLIECLGRLSEIFRFTPEELKKVESGEISSLKMHWEKGRDVIYGLSALVPELFICDFLGRKLESFQTKSQDILTIFHLFDNFLPIKFLWRGVLISNIVFFGPIIEELLFRDLLYSWIEKKQAKEEVSWKTLWRAQKIPPNAWHQRITRIFITSVLFGLVHASLFQGWMNLPVFVVTTFLGIVFAILREITKNTTASKTLHCAHNFTVMTAVLLS